jgi:hypothetical protein
MAAAYPTASARYVVPIKKITGPESFVEAPRTTATTAP